MSKVLLLNGSPHESGCVATALDEMIKVFQSEGLETMRNLARCMSFMIKAFASCKEASGLPVFEREAFTSFPDGKQ